MTKPASSVLTRILFMRHEFNNYPWHDAELLDISINRRQPGKKDEVIIKIRWQGGKEVAFLFCDCFKLEIHMNFGVIATETIIDAGSIEDNSDLDIIREKWGETGVSLDNIELFWIETASTASFIKIYATKFKEISI